jgi:predicted GNAT family acetyltransferase
MAAIVTDNTEASRFELTVDDILVSTATYSIRDDTVRINHVETDPRERGRGRAAELMAGLLDLIRNSDRSVLPLCSYAVGYTADNPDTHDLLA